MRNKKGIFYNVVFFIALLLFNVSLFGQAYWNIVTVDPLEICLGDCVEPYSDGDQSVVLMNNDFNSQTIGTGWVSNANPSFSNPCEVAGDGNDGTPHLWIGSTASFPRDLTTVAYSVTAQCQICFDLKFATQGVSSPCEGPDEVDEGVSLQWSTNGGATWTDIIYFSPDGCLYPSNIWVGQGTSVSQNCSSDFIVWNNYCFNVPAAATGNNTQFQWHQEQVTSATCDHWGVDNVVIDCPTPNVTIEWHDSYTNTIFSTIGDPPPYCPTNSTTITATIDDGIGSDVETFDVIVYQPPTLSFSIPADFCSADPVYPLTGTPVGGAFSGPGVSGNAFDPAVAGVGTHTITYTWDQYNSAGTTVLCSFTTTQNTTVHASPTSTFTTVDVCINNNSDIIYTGNGGAGDTYGWNFNGGTIVSGTGQGPYQVYWTTANTYTVSLTVTDAYGCSSTSTMPVVVSDPGAANAGTGGSECDWDFTFNGSTSVGGSWSYTGPGGATFVPNANTPTATVNVDTDGTYIFTWTEGTAGCYTTDNVQVIFYQTPIANAGTGGSECDFDFDLNAIPSVGTGTWTYTGPGNALFNPNANSPTATVTVTVEGTYTYTWTEDNNGCIDSDDVQVIFYEQPIANAGSGGSYCSDNYTFTAVASAGTGTWTYTGPGTASFVPNANTANATVTVGTWGTYTFTWTENSNGCIDSDDVTVTFNYTPTSDFTVNPAAVCIGDDASITYTGTGSPTAIYTWNFDGGTATPGTGQGPHAVNWNSSGTADITLQVTENGCTSIITTQQVTIYPDPTSDFVVTQPPCFGDDAILTYTGTASSSATFNWTYGGGSAIPGGTVIGPQYVNYTSTNTYDVSLQVTENGCISTVSTYQVIVQEQLSSNIIGTDILCFGELNGAADLTVSGGVLPHTFLWSDQSTDEDIFNVAADDYGVTITDDNGCILIDHITILEPPPIVLTPPLDKNICNGQSVTLTANASGGTGNLYYVWNGDTTTTNSILVSPIVNTAYTVFVFDDNGCFTSVEIINVLVSPGVTLELFANDTFICPGDPVYIHANYLSGVPPYYLTSGDGSVISTPFIVNPTEETEYIVNVVDQCGSIAVDNITIYIYPVTIPEFQADPSSGCTPLTVNFHENNPNLYEYYLWNFGDNDFDNLSFDDNPTHIYDDPGTYDVTLTVTSYDGCESKLTIPNMITVYPTPHAQFIADPEVVSIIKPYIYFENFSSLADQYLWVFGDGDSSSIINPIHIYPMYPTGTYNVTLIAYTLFGCTDTAYQEVIVQDEYTFYAPTAFSPDFDGINDYFIIKGNGIDKRNFNMMIYDRWGEVIFETDDLHMGWDGRVKGGNIAKIGTYTWLVTFKNHKGIQHQEGGSVTVIK